MSAILEARGLSYIYSGGTPFEKAAVRDVSLAVEAGETVGIIGHTGSGKSTLMQHFNGLLKPSAGQIFVGGEDIWAKPKEIRGVRFRVGLVFQYPEHQLFEETVEKDIAFGPKNMGLSEADIRERVMEAAQFAGVPEELLAKSPFDLSGGEKRRVAIAGVMAMRPEVLIFDEPTAGLDPRGRDMILERIRAYKREQPPSSPVTVLMVSHSMEDVARMADRVLVMRDGEAAMCGGVDDVFARAAELEGMGLTIPAVTRIFMGLRARGLDVGENAYTMEQAVSRLLPLVGSR